MAQHRVDRGRPRLDRFADHARAGRAATVWSRKSSRAGRSSRPRAATTTTARALFVERGYVPTTLADIAAAAGAGALTVKAAYGTKSGVLAAVWERAADHRPTDEPVTDPSDHLRRKIARRVEVSGRAAQADAEIGALWALCRPGSATRSDASSRCCTRSTTARATRSSTGGGWSPERYRAWLARTLIEQLIEP
ncbi:TetR family transcriptional regulator [Pseudonocardia sp. CA-107938]|uniref:TetR family transcriptional regulator n=1 Tax=Pseudonocardia sp. CA-107938 TaxID=3240021 RepID=UPI003D90F489